MFYSPHYGIKIITENYISFSTGKEIGGDKRYIVNLSGSDVYKEVFFTDNLEDAKYVRNYLEDRLDKKPKTNKYNVALLCNKK